MSVETSAIIDELARAQHGLVTSEQAVRALGPGVKGRWVAAGRLVSVQPSVFRVLGAPETWHQSVLAASLASGGVVSHRSAAEVWGLIQPAGYVEVAAKPEHKTALRPPAVLHRIADLDPAVAVDRHGLRITDPVRTVIDLGLVLPKWSVSDALSRGLTTRLLGIAEVDRLRSELSRRGRNGVGIMRELLEARMLTANTEESVLEARFVDLVRLHDLPRPAFQHEIWHAGRFMARVDAAYPDILLAIEIDGYAAHSSPDAFQRDRTRQNRLVALGWTVLRFTFADIVKEATAVASAIQQARARLQAPGAA